MILTQEASLLTTICIASCCAEHVSINTTIILREAATAVFYRLILADSSVA